MVLVDAPFTEVGDDVTVDYDGQVRCHSFEDRIHPREWTCVCAWLFFEGFGGLLYIKGNQKQSRIYGCPYLHSPK